MGNINSKEYWEKRFRTGNWGKAGSLQTMQYASYNIMHIDLNKNFSGTLLDFGCALGDSIPVYRNFLPNAKLLGIDISSSAIEQCKKRYGNLATFLSGDYRNTPKSDYIIASHVMEHLSNDREIVAHLLEKCKYLYIFVPYKETPLYVEHVNYYDKEYYSMFTVEKIKNFEIKIKRKQGIFKTLRGLFENRFSIYTEDMHNIVMYCLKGRL